MGRRVWVILWAQARTLWNYLPRSNKFGLAFSLAIGVAWYGGFIALAIAAGFLLSNPNQTAETKVISSGLLLAFVYWQVFPLLLASTGSALDTRKLMIYPVPKRELFALEVLLRLSTGIEVVIVFTGAAIGLLLNPRIPFWAPLSLFIYAIFNLLVSAGVRDLLARWLARKVIREVLVFLFVIAAALPQVILVNHPGSNPLHILAPYVNSLVLPWVAAAELAIGRFNAAAMLILFGWVALAYLFGRWQFEQNLLFDPQESLSSSAQRTRTSWTGILFQWPGRIFRDPLAVLIEKELRFLARSARFRLVFLMGFSFGLLIWLPVTFGAAGLSKTWMGRNYLAVVSAYALLLLSDVLFWNTFGFDRAAAQIYFIAPVRIRTVMHAKNIAALFWIFIDVTLIAVICAVLRFPISGSKLMEAYAVTLIAGFFLMAAGNLSSAYNPRAIDPSKSFRSSAGRQTQAALMLLFPVSLLPVALAYAARYAFGGSAAFWGVLVFDALFGWLLYHIATDSAVAAMGRRTESIIDALSKTEGPIAA